MEQKKLCTQCKNEKFFEEFPLRKISKDGRYSWCKKCCAEKTKKYALEHPENIRATKAKRKDKALEHARKYKEVHKEELRKKQKIYYDLNREKLCEKSRNYSKYLTDEQKKKKREYHKIWRNSQAGKEYLKNIWKQRKQTYKIHYKASEKVKDAIKSGKLIRAEKCMLCLSNEKIEAHHPDYNKPLDVVWVCQKCHRMLHRGMKERNIKPQGV